MNVQKIDQIFKDTAYIRTGGSPEELRCAHYLQSKCAELGGEAQLWPFEIDMADIHEAKLYADGKEIPCKGYFGAGSGEAEGELYYLRNLDEYSLKQCKDKIVMIDGYIRYWTYQDLLDHGARGFITYDGNANFADRDIDQRELRETISKGRKVPGVNINAKDAIELIRGDVSSAKIVLKQDEYKGESNDVILELPGQIDEWIVLTAHYDSTWLSTGAYDNMSGSIGLLGIAEHFAKAPHRYGLRFIWCGSEERGLLGSKAYCSAREEELEKVVLNVNLDMIGCIMGRFIACCTSEEKLVHYIEYLASEQGFSVAARDGVYSSDSTPFADKGIPAVSFARIAPANTASYHNSYDTLKVMKAQQMKADIEFITAFVDRMANAKLCPVKREMPEKMREKLDIYLNRKRDTSGDK